MFYLIFVEWSSENHLFLLNEVLRITDIIYQALQQKSQDILNALNSFLSTNNNNNNNNNINNNNKRAQVHRNYTRHSPTLTKGNYQDQTQIN